MHRNKWLPIFLIFIAGWAGSASYAAESGPDAQADPLYVQAGQLQQEGKIDAALAVYSKLLQSKPDHPDALWNRGRVYLQLKNYALAEDDLRHVTKLVPEFADAQGTLAWVLILQGKGQQAIAPASKAHELDAANIYITANLGHAYLLTGEEHKAQEVYLAAVKLIKEQAEFDAMLDDLRLFVQNNWKIEECKRSLTWVERIYAHRDELKQADELFSQVVRLKEEGNYAQALIPARVYSETIGRILGEENHDYTTSLNNLAFLYDSSGDYDKALPLYQQVLEIEKKVLGDDSHGYATSLNNLAFLYYSMGDYTKAMPLYQRALEIIQKIQGEEHPDYLSCLNNLALLYNDMGDYVKALPLYQQVLESRKKSLGNEHPDYADSLNNLAVLYYAMGGYDKALPLYQQALEIRKKSLGERHPDYAVSLNNLAILYGDMGKYDKALPLYQQALEIKKKTLGESHPAYANSINNLAFSHYAMGDYDKALPLYQQALEIRKKSLGEKHPDYADSLNNLAILYGDMGKYDKALPLYRQTCALYKKALGEEHSLYANCINNFAVFLGVQRRSRDALNLLVQASRITDRHIAHTFAVLTEQQKLQFVHRHAGEVHGMLSLIHRQLANDAEAVRSGLDLILSRKGIVFDAQARQGDAIARSLDPEAKKLWDELSSWRSMLVKLMQVKSEKISAEEYQNRIAECQAEIAKLETTLASKSTLIAQDLKQRKITSKEVAQTLGKNAVLVEYVKIHDYDWDHDRWANTWRYLAFILHVDGKVKLIDLGDAAVLEKSVQAALKSIGLVGSNGEQQQAATRSLHALLWQPLAVAVGHVDKVVFSPDGLLNLVPFAAMQDNGGHYLIESKQVAYVTSGRDLTKGDLGIKPESELYLAANPQFDLRAPVSADAAETSGTTRSAGFAMNFTPLPGTAKEAEQIPAYLKGKQTVLTGTQATEESVLAVRRPRVMHLSTHGFFLADQAAAVQGTRGAVRIKVQQDVMEKSALVLPPGYENPLVRSGLAFAGANHASEAQGGRDGLLTALEVSGMDLHGTDLVTLSACETGRGEVKSGEGVFGLRRAFALAGTSHLMMSLWPVSDAVTAQQMQTFYQLYGKHTKPAAALRQAQLATIADLRSRKGQAEPALWAPFIVQGE